MKIKQMLYDWRRCLSLAGAAAAVLFSTSCKDDPTEEVLPRNSSEGICFEPTFGPDDWNTMPQTRSGGVEEFPIDTTYVIEVPDATPDGEPLYVHVEVRDGIDSPTLRQLSADASQTRASMVDAKNFHPSFAAFAYSYETWNGKDEFNLMKELKVEKDKGWATEVQWPKTGSVNFYAYAPHQSDNKAATITYKGRIAGDSSDPSNLIATGDGLILDYNEKGGVNFCDFVVGATGTAKVSEYGATGKKPEMWFHHALAAVKVKSGSVFDRCYISGLLFEQIYRAGTLRTHPNSLNLRWSDHTRRDSKNFLFAISDYFWVGPNQNMLSKNAADSVYFAVPQDLVLKNADGTETETQTQLKILYKPTDTPGTTDQEEVLLPIGKDKNGKTLKWEAGRTYTYTITRKPPVTWDYTFEVAGSTSTTSIPEVSFYNWGAAGSTINIKSFMKPQDGSSPQQSVDWSYEYSTDGGTTWTAASGGNFSNVLSVFGGSKNAPSGNGSNHSLKATVLWPESWTNELNTTLKNAPERGSSQNRYDLSTKGGSAVRNTANCYIVNAPGSYKIPIVHGNAIKNGITNQLAYKRDATNSHTSTYDWLTYNGNTISDPWILKQYTTPETSLSTRVEWQDVQNLVVVQGVEYNSNGECFLRFDVNQSVIKQGNAVISVLRSGTVIWSWHIWITPYNPDQTTSNDFDNMMGNREIRNNAGQTFTLMGLPLGYVMGDTRTFTEKTMLLRFKQTSSGKQRTVKLRRLAGKARKPGQMPLYQYGHHVPYPGALYTSTKPGDWENVPQVSTWGTNPIMSKTGRGTTADMIKNPTTIFTDADLYPWMNDRETWTNRWDMLCTPISDNAAGLHTRKSVYDPSPAGYALPTRNTFSGFCKSGTTATGTQYKNWSTPFQYEAEFYAEYGCHFKVHVNATDDTTLFLPTTGWLNPGYQGVLYQGTANQACYWTATYYKGASTKNDRAYALKFSIKKAAAGEESLNGNNMYIDTQALTHTTDCIGVICVKEQ